MTLKILPIANKQCVITIITILMQSTIGMEADQKIKRQNLIPSARIGRELFLTDEDIPAQFPTSWEEDMDFSSSEPSYIDSEVFLNTESDDEDLEDDFSNEPTVNRKKRSLSDDQSTEDKTGMKKASPTIKPNWSTENKNDYFQTEKRKPRNMIFIPRIGKKSYYDEINYANKRAVFIPRIGKKNFGDTELTEDKRAIFIPRIGKKSYANIDNSDAKRAVFIPRIGRAAAFIPKVASNTPQYRVSGRVIFIPRIG